MEQEIKVGCKNCKFYSEHYIKRNSRLLAVGGRCLNEKFKGKYQENKPQLYDNCEYFEINTQTIERRKERIIEVLTEMRDKISDIALILKSDKEGY